MKKPISLHGWKLILISFLTLLTTHVHAQSQRINNDQWVKEINAEEVKINAYIEQQLMSPLSPEAKAASKREACDSLLVNSTASERKELEVFELRNYFRQEYFNKNITATQVYNPGRIKPVATSSTTPEASSIITCENGDFESGVATGYSGYAGNWIGTLPISCNAIPFSNVTYAPVTIPSTNNFQIMNAGPDPIIPALQQTNNGSNHSIQINASTPCSPNSGVNMLQKQIPISTTGYATVSFSYALVMESASDERDEWKPFFIARVLNSAGVEVGSRVCRIADISDPAFQVVSRNRQTWGCNNSWVNVFWRDWSCASIGFDAIEGQTYTLEFFAADCGALLHFGYAYVDDICAEVDCCPMARNLNCEIVDGGRLLSWDPIPGYSTYVLEYILNEQTCCNNGLTPVHQGMAVNGNSVVLPFSTYNCFTWRIMTYCKDGTPVYSPWECNCKPECNPPIGLDCEPKDDGWFLSWSSVPGISSYVLEITEDDPLCCNNGNTPQSPVGLWVNGTSTTIPYSSFGCFSFRVRSVCADGNQSALSQYHCSCSGECDPPDGLSCEPLEDGSGSQLYWNAVPGISSYVVEFTENDPACCSTSAAPVTRGKWVNGTTTTISYSGAPCYSWAVRSVCPDGSQSALSNSICNCILCIPPDTTWCQPMDYMSWLHWSAVPQAAYYLLTINLNDPICCSSGSPSTMIINVPGTDILMSTLTNQCYSWSVQSVCYDGSVSAPTTTKCSCDLEFLQKPGNNSATAFSDVQNANCIIASPNPASKYIDFRINPKCPDSNRYQGSVLHIYDSKGSQVSTLPIKGKESVRFNILNLTPGLYTYKIIDEKGEWFNSKFVIIP